MFRQFISPVKTAFRNCLMESTALSRSGTSGIAAVPSMSSGLHTSSSLYLGRKQRGTSGDSWEKKELEAEGEKTSIVELQRSLMDDRFPDLNLPTRVFNGTQFKDLHIVNIKATKNNTIFSVTDANGLCSMIRSCGIDGFKSARRGTNVAAQATGFILGKKMMQRGHRTVRARVQGLGAGRLASLRGLTLAGVQVVSITDNTAVSWNPPRPRKQRRI